MSKGWGSRAGALALVALVSSCASGGANQGSAPSAEPSASPAPAPPGTAGVVVLSGGKTAALAALGDDHADTIVCGPSDVPDVISIPLTRDSSGQVASPLAVRIVNKGALFVTFKDTSFTCVANTVTDAGQRPDAVAFVPDGTPSGAGVAGVVRPEAVPANSPPGAGSAAVADKPVGEACVTLNNFVGFSVNLPPCDGAISGGSTRRSSAAGRARANPRPKL